MLEDQLEKVICNIYQFIGINKEVTGLLVKKHSNNLLTLGDLSFPNTVKICYGLSNDLVKSDSFPALLQLSSSWDIPIKKAIEIKDRVHLFIERPIATKLGLSQSLVNNEYILSKINNHIGDVESDCEKDSSITSLRLNYTTNVIRNLYNLNSKCSVLKPKVLVTAKSSTKCEGKHIILCGAVLNSKTGVKETTMTADEFIRLRQEELTLIALHKYGIRVSSDAKRKEFIAHLGESAAAFELLQVRPSSPVKIQFDSSSGSSKGAAFILYNCARLETIIRTFNDKVDSGVYPPLPNIDDIDFSLLNQEEEWSLVFNYVLGLPSLIKNSVDISEDKCEFRPHLICSFLSSMVRLFSQYYRKSRVLTEPRKHLLPVLFARIYLLQALTDTLKTCLRLLNIKSVTQMYLGFYLNILILFGLREYHTFKMD